MVHKFGVQQLHYMVEMPWWIELKELHLLSCCGVPKSRRYTLRGVVRFSHIWDWTQRR